MANQLKPEELKEVLGDVRQAYRLLYTYQRRVLDTVRFIGTKMGFTFNTGQSLFTDNINHRTVLESKRWAWDFFPGYNYWYAFNGRVIGSNQNFEFGIMVISDSGYYSLKNEEVNKNDKLKLDEFEDASSSETQIAFVLRKLNAEKKHNFNHLTELMFMPLSTTTQSVKRENNGVIFLGQKFDLSNLSDEETTINCLGKFIKLCNDNGLKDPAFDDIISRVSKVTKEI